jgi:uncharacterized protein
MTNQDASYLPIGMPVPRAEADGLSKPYWDAARKEVLLVQRCAGCATWLWGPEWICHACHSFDLDWVEVAGHGRIFTWQRSHHPVHPVLHAAVPYISVLVELPQAGKVRMIGNLLGDPAQSVEVGASVDAVFEHHDEVSPGYTLVQWQYRD